MQKQSILVALTYILLPSYLLGMSNSPLSVQASDLNKLLLRKAQSEYTADINAVNDLIRQGADVNVRDGLYNKSVLAYAAGNGHSDMIELFLATGTYTQEDKDNALRFAIIGNGSNSEMHNDVVEDLIDAGANVNVDKGFVFCRVILKGNERLFNKFLETPGIDLNIKGALHRNPLREAVENGRLLMFEKLLTLTLDFQQEEKDNLLMYAAASNQRAMAQKLIELGANIYAGREFGKQEGEACVLARTFRHDDLVKMFTRLYAKDQKNK